MRLKLCLFKKGVYGLILLLGTELSHSEGVLQEIDNDSGSIQTITAAIIAPTYGARFVKLFVDGQ